VHRRCHYDAVKAYRLLWYTAIRSFASGQLSRSSPLETHFAGKGYGELKRTVADLVIMTLGPIQERYDALMHDRAALDALLQKGADSARQRAAVTLRTVKERVGLLALPCVED